MDYGCGKGALIATLQKKYPQIAFWGYDPAIPGRDKIPVEKADLVINTDVLEHIPEEELPEVVEMISSISPYVFFNLFHGIAGTVLDNGENAHCTVKSQSWYIELFKKYFKQEFTVLPSDSEETSIVCTFPLSEVAQARFTNLIYERKRRNQVIRQIECKNRTRSTKFKRFLFGNYDYTYIRLLDYSLHGLQREYAKIYSRVEMMKTTMSSLAIFAAILTVIIMFNTTLAAISQDPFLLIDGENAIFVGFLVLSIMLLVLIRASKRESLKLCALKFLIKQKDESVY